MTTNDDSKNDQPSFLRTLVDSQRFKNFVLIVIVIAGITVGLETDKWIVAKFGTPLRYLNDGILWIFVIEIAAKIGAEGRRPWRFFYDSWNVFDFLIVGVAFLPFNASYIAVLRLARLFRFLRLVRAVPKLQLVVSALLKSAPGMVYVGLLLFLLFYMYAVSAVFLFGDNDPVHFGHLPIALLSLFRVVTGEDWTDVMYIQMNGCDKYGYGGMEELCTNPHAYPVFGAFFFVTFMFVGAMVILNLFIGVIMNGMEEAKKEREILDALELDAGHTFEGDLGDVKQHLLEVIDKIESLQIESRRSIDMLMPVDGSKKPPA
jgi:voltage-gated sodium channel